MLRRATRRNLHDHQKRTKELQRLLSHRNDGPVNEAWLGSQRELEELELWLLRDVRYLEEVNAAIDS